MNYIIDTCVLSDIYNNYLGRLNKDSLFNEYLVSFKELCVQSTFHILDSVNDEYLCKNEGDSQKHFKAVIMEHVIKDKAHEKFFLEQLYPYIYNHGETTFKGTTCKQSHSAKREHIKDVDVELIAYAIYQIRKDPSTQWTILTNESPPDAKKEEKHMSPREGFKIPHMIKTANKKYIKGNEEALSYINKIHSLDILQSIIKGNIDH